MTNPPAATALTALRRADRAWCKETADEQLDETRLRHLAAAAEAGLGASERSAAQAAEVDQLNTWKGEYDRLAAELEKINVARAADLREVDTWQSEYERVVGDKLVELTEALEERDRARAERDQVLAELARVHRHAWDVQPGLKDMGLPCACGRPWPNADRALHGGDGAG